MCHKMSSLLWDMYAYYLIAHGYRFQAVQMCLPNASYQKLLFPVETVLDLFLLSMFEKNM